MTYRRPLFYFAVVTPAELIKELEKGRFQPVYYFYGTEEYRIKEAEKAVVTRPVEEFGPPKPDLPLREEAFEQAVIRPTPVAARPKAARVKRPARRTPSIFAPARKREERQRFRFSDNPIVNGVIFSELLGPPIAKRPHRKRRMF